MEIEVKKLKSFFNVATLNATIPTLVLKFGTSGISVKAKNQDDSVFTLVKLPKESFDKYNVGEEFKVGIRDTDLFNKILSTFDGKVYLDVKENYLIVYNANKQANIIISSADNLVDNYIKEIPDALKSFDDGVKVSSSMLKNVVGNISCLGTNKTVFTSKNGVLTVETGDKNFDRISEKTPLEYKDFKGTFSSVNITNIINEITKENSEVMLSVLDQPVMQFKNINDNYTAKVIVAPTEDEEQEDEPVPEAEEVIIDEDFE
ncbi:MAG: hypothetical protein ACOC22_00585 [bacterium]